MLTTTLAGIPLNGYVYNASGVNNEIFKQLQKIAESSACAVLTKSTTLEARSGNESPKYVVKSGLIPGCSFNSMGLPNKGFTQTAEFVDKLKEISDKPVIISLSGLSFQENVDLFSRVQKTKADLIELNLSCPNIAGKALVGYDLEQMKNLLQKLFEIGGPIPLGLKLPPYLDLTYFDPVCELILKYKISYIASINTIGNSLVIDPDKESVIIKPKNGLGGLGGDYLKPVALGNVHNFYIRLKDQVSVVGVGGVRTGRDAFEFLLAGCDAVQIGTTFAHEGIEAFARINAELEQILQQKGYANIADAKGKLKYL